MAVHLDECEQLLNYKCTGQKSRQTNQWPHEETYIVSNIESLVREHYHSSWYSNHSHSIKECYVEFFVLALSVHILDDIIGYVTEEYYVWHD